MGTPLRSAFVVESREIGDVKQRRPHIVAGCRLCGKQEAIPIANHCGNVSAELGSKLFRKRGWKMGNNRQKDECFRCASAAKIMSAPEEMRDAMDTFVLVQDLVGHVAPETVEELPMRQPKVRAPNPDNMPTAIGAAMVEAAIEKTEGGKPKSAAGERFAQINANRTPEERQRIARLGAEAAKTARDQRTAEAARKAAKGAGLKNWWAGKSKEERSQIMRDRNAQRKNIKIDNAHNDDLPETPMPQAEPDNVTALVPRKATREQNRDIHDALDKHYDADRGYLGGMRDKTLAEKLNMPVAWIAAVREQFFGPDTSEVDAKTTKEINAVWAKLTDLDARSQKMLEDLAAQDSERKKLTDELHRICDRAGLPSPLVKA